MLFRTQIALVRAIPEDRPYIPENDVVWHDTVIYTFGINAEDATDAVAIAVRAAENAIDRRGEFVGGVVVEVQSKCIGPEEFEGYGKYLLQRLDERGIFYVSGITYSACAIQEAHGVTKTLRSVRDWIKKNGLPAPSFVHPRWDDETRRVRIVCPVCQHWAEVDNAGLLYSFFDGLDTFSSVESEEARKARAVAGPFVRRHFRCLNQRSDVNALVFLDEDDHRYALLDECKRE